MLPSQKCLLGRIVVGNRCALGSLSALLVHVRVSGHWQQSDVQWRNCWHLLRFEQLSRRRKLKCYLAYISAGGDETLWPFCIYIYIIISLYQGDSNGRLKAVV